MAIVYLAHDLLSDRDVAIKALRPELSFAGPAERFLQEIRITAELRHPRILPQLDSGEVDGVLYYVTPYISGGSLRDRLDRESPLTLDETLRVARQVAEALDAAHASGVVHRDIKPENILLSGSEAIVADFGIARILNVVTAKRLTDYGLALGTPQYMSPEQSAADRKIDHRSDIYSLACVVYEMLAAEPPFTGPSKQAISAKHQHEPPPSLRVVRPGLPEYVQDAVEKALSKTAADRPQTAGEFARALATPRVTAARRRIAVRVAVIAGSLALIAAAWLRLAAPSVPLDPQKIMVFPLLQVGQARDRGQGEAVALMIGSALEHAEPLKWIYGWTWLDSSRRADIGLLDARLARRVARAHGARFFVDGSIVGYHDSSSVILRLVDTKGDSVVAQATASGLPEQAALLGLRAINQLLPRVLDPGRRVNIELLAGVRPASTAAWLQGEREFRRSHFKAALDYYRRALAEDSAMTLAAVKGAEAASWANQNTEARQLANIAVIGEARLPLKYAHMARGLRAFLDGSADSAVHYFVQAVEQDSSWAEGWMALGDAYYHLVPALARPDSVAELAFVTSQRLDPELSPSFFHLAEFAIRRRDRRLAERLAATFQPSSPPDSVWLQRLDLMIECVRRGPRAMDWVGAARRHPEVVVQAAKAFSAGGADLQCAEGGFRAAYGSDSSAVSTRWGALLGLDAVLVAQGRTSDANVLLDSAASAGLRAARALHAVNAAASETMDSVARVVADEWGSSYVGMPLGKLWHQMLWATHQRDTTALSAMLAAIRHGSDSSEAARSISAGLEARLALARLDSAAAIRMLDPLHAFGSATDVTWGLWQSQAFERLLLAELFLARRRFGDALRVASEFDHPQPILYVACLPRSLQVRYRAALALGKSREAEAYAGRLRSMGRGDLVVGRRLQ